MSIALIPFWIPLLWALIITIYWRFKVEKPINDWIVCVLVFVVNVFWFAYVCLFFVAFAVFKHLSKKDESKK